MQFNNVEKRLRATIAGALKESRGAATKIEIIGRKTGEWGKPESGLPVLWISAKTEKPEGVDGQWVSLLPADTFAARLKEAARVAYRNQDYRYREQEIANFPRQPETVWARWTTNECDGEKRLYCSSCDGFSCFRLGVFLDAGEVLIPVEIYTGISKEEIDRAFNLKPVAWE
jgi:hypothetical protein